METQIIERAFIIALIVIALWCCCLDGMIFGSIRKLKVPEWLKSPLYDCPVCQVPYYGSAIYWLFFHNSVNEWALVIGVASGMASVFVKIKRN